MILGFITYLMEIFMILMDIILIKKVMMNSVGIMNMTIVMFQERVIKI